MHFAIVDEADSVLIDEARTPLIISAPAGSQFGTEVLARAMEIAAELKSPEDYGIEAAEHRIILTEAGRERITSLATGAARPRPGADASPARGWSAKRSRPCTCSTGTSTTSCATARW
ncbi:hypothetical protein [Methylorubrum extorquens]